MKLVLSILILLTSSYLSAQENNSGTEAFLSSQAKFLSRADDSLSLVKKQLIYLGTKELISKELDRMGLQSDLFWLRYQEELEKEKETLKEKYETRYNIKTGNVSKTKRLNFEKVLRLKTLDLERDFGNITQVLDSYKISSISRSSNNPLLRFINIKGRIDRRRLKNLYFNFFKSSDDSSQISNLYWFSSLKMTQGDWDTFGVSNKEKIISAINNSLLRKLTVGVSDSVDKILFADGLINKKIKSYVSRLTKKAEDLEKENGEVTNENIVDDYEFSRSSFAEFKGFVSIKNVNEDLGVIDVEVLHNISIINLFNYEPILITKPRKTSISLRKDKDQNIASQLASFLHNQFSGYLPSLTESIKKEAKTGSSSRLVLNGISSVNEILQFQEILRKSGVSLRLDSSINKMNLTTCNLSLQFLGKEEQLRQILQGVSGSRVGSDKIVKLVGDNVPYNFVLR